MKKYFIVSDTHSFYQPLMKALDDKGFSINDPSHILILLGDAFDRGQDAQVLGELLLTLNDMNRLIFVKGNHESLLSRLLMQLARGDDPVDIAMSYHAINGTWQTALDLAQMKESEAIRFPQELVSRVMNSRVYRELLPSCIDFWELGNKYICTHGYIPCIEHGIIKPYISYSYDENWRNASPERWDSARWYNSAELAVEKRIYVPDRTLIVGHIHASYFYSRYGENKSSEWGEDAIFNPYIAPDKSIICIDACTAFSNKINCIVIDEQGKLIC